MAEVEAASGFIQGVGALGEENSENQGGMDYRGGGGRGSDLLACRRELGKTDGARRLGTRDGREPALSVR